MKQLDNQIGKKKLLVFNCHEAWVHQLQVLEYNLEIIVDLKGRFKQTWDEQMRPLPAGCHLVKLSEALNSKKRYYCIITHNITDLLDIKFRPEARLIVLHSTVEGRILEEKSEVGPQKMIQKLHEYLDLVGGHAVAISMLKGKSWGFTEDIVHHGVDVADYPPYVGSIPAGLRICNFIDSRKKILMWNFYQKAFDGIPVRLVGHNPNMAKVKAAENWDHLKEILQAHRFYIHTADPRLEDGYNLASLEAMAAGLPVLGNQHPTSPVVHGVSGFLSDDPDELRSYANLLLADKVLAVNMGEQARKTIKKRFSLINFKKSFLRSIETARRKRKRQKCSFEYFMEPLDDYRTPLRLNTE